MTEPVPPDTTDYTAVLATAAVAYALIAVEARVREDVEQAIADAFDVIAALLTVTIAAPVAVTAAINVFTTNYFHQGFTQALAQAREATADAVASGYQAAAVIARDKAAQQFARLDYMVPAELPYVGDNLDRILADVDTMFGHAQTDLQTRLTATYDGIQGDDPTAARIVALNQLLQQAQVAITARAANTAATAVHTGANDTQQAIYTQYQSDAGPTGLMKRWKVVSADPCGMCAALDGTMVGLAGEFDHDATTVDRDLRPVWRSLQGPPRHPNCRCTIELVAT